MGAWRRSPAADVTAHSLGLRCGWKGSGAVLAGAQQRSDVRAWLIMKPSHCRGAERVRAGAPLPHPDPQFRQLRDGVLSTGTWCWWPRGISAFGLRERAPTAALLQQPAQRRITLRRPDFPASPAERQRPARAEPSCGSGARAASSGCARCGHRRPPVQHLNAGGDGAESRHLGERELLQQSITRTGAR